MSRHSREHIESLSGFVHAEVLAVIVSLAERLALLEDQLGVEVEDPAPVADDASVRELEQLPETTEVEEVDETTVRVKAKASRSAPSKSGANAPDVSVTDGDAN